MCLGWDPYPSTLGTARGPNQSCMQVLENSRELNQVVQELPVLSIMLSTNLNPCVVVQVTVEEQNECEAADPRNNVLFTNAILIDVRHLDLHAHTCTLVAWVQSTPSCAT